MLLDRRAVLANLILAGSAASAREVQSSYLPTVRVGRHKAASNYYVLESGQRKEGCYSIAIVRNSFASDHEEALLQLRKSVGYDCHLSHRSRDRNKAALAEASIEYIMRQSDVYFYIMFVPDIAHLANRQSWKQLIKNEYLNFTKFIPPSDDDGLLTWKSKTPKYAPHSQVVEQWLFSGRRGRVVDDERAQTGFMQISSLIVGAITSSLAGREVRGSNQAVRRSLEQACGTRKLTLATMNRIGKFRILIAKNGAAGER